MDSYLRIIRVSKDVKHLHSSESISTHNLFISDLRFSSIVATEEGVLFAATMGQGIYKIDPDNSWVIANEGLPDHTMTYRLKVVNSMLLAATHKGLFFYENEHWYPTDIQVPCYDVVKRDSYLSAGTEMGLLSQIAGKWRTVAYTDWIIYQLLTTPEFLFVGCQHGIAMYDCLTGTWHEFNLRTRITSMAVYQKRLVGVSELGNLVIGDMKGGFTESQFGNLFIYALKQNQQEVYACTNQGLYKLSIFKGDVMLKSIVLGYAVTDIEFTDQYIIAVTYQNGIKKIRKY